MMMSMYSAVSGLKSQQTKLNVIGNNVANINTLGYKGQSVGFSDLLSQTISSAGAASGTRGGTNAKQIGLGSQVASISTNMSTGSSQYTGNDTDAALSGSGFFEVFQQPLLCRHKIAFCHQFAQLPGHRRDLRLNQDQLVLDRQADQASYCHKQQQRQN